MKHHDRKLSFALFFVCGCLPLVSCAPATNVDPGENAQAADTAASGTAPAEGQADAQPTDVIDRIFAPLDNAVTDINRDLNKGDTGTPAEPDE